MIKFDEIVGEWLDVSLDAAEAEHQSDVEPFKAFKERAKAKGIRAFNDYLNSIEHGYELIIQRIESAMK